MEDKEKNNMREPMNLIGGIMKYGTVNEFAKRYKSEQSPKGRKVEYLAENGYDYEREEASELFDKGDVLTVEEIYVGSCFSTVVFMDFPNKEFNTVMFADCE